MMRIVGRVDFSRFFFFRGKDILRFLKAESF